MHAAQPLSNRVILVTGAGSGIGEAVACGCAAQGATVVLVGRTAHTLAQTYDAIELAGHPQPAIFTMDLEQAAPHDYEAFAATLRTEFGHLNGLVHCAATLGALCPLEHYDPGLWVKVMQINLHAPFLLTRACLPLLKGTAEASVVFTSSGVGRKGKAYWGAYGVAKAGLENMMEMLADELEADGKVRVNSVDPGAVRTRLRARAYPGENPATLPEPDAVVPTYLYLLGPDSRGITGRRFAAQGTAPLIPLY